MASGIIRTPADKSFRTRLYVQKYMYVSTWYKLDLKMKTLMVKTLRDLPKDLHSPNLFYYSVFHKSGRVN